MVIVRIYKYRLYPTKQQVKTLLFYERKLKHFWNLCWTQQTWWLSTNQNKWIHLTEVKPTRRSKDKSSSRVKEFFYKTQMPEHQQRQVGIPF